MKKILIKSAVAINLVLLLTAGLTSKAQTADKTFTELRIDGEIKNEPVFTLSLHNKTAGKYIIVITDDEGTIMHEEKISGIDITRKYWVDREQVGTREVFIEVYNGNSIEASYSIKHHRITEVHQFTVKRK